MLTTIHHRNLTARISLLDGSCVVTLNGRMIGERQSLSDATKLARKALGL